MSHYSKILYDSRKYVLINSGYYYYSARGTPLLLIPGLFYTNRRNLQPEVYIMDETVPKLLGQWPSFWHYPLPDSNSPREPISGAMLVGGKEAPLMYTGEVLRDE